MIASRHLDVTTRSDAAPRLQKLAQEVISQRMFNSVPSTESIESFLIMSLWVPIGGADVSNEDRDARMLVGTAVNAAMNLRLNEASSRVNKLRDEGNNALGGNELLLETDKVRLVSRIVPASFMLPMLISPSSGWLSLPVNQR